ncbi:MAG TPA: 3-keto-5-aminohexanoate cleavage protein [Thermodesulfobacteriota bacterium]|jgi:3-keto-5-aminohexanoate cleavage enzyme|nr:3-keto-5-aminohexanoate cleavage protein [Thermodesulfobacteriota bacterium]
MEKIMISVGVTGSRITPQQTPYIPITPEEIAQAGIEAWRAGASILHIHVRDPKTGLGTQDGAIFKEVVDRIRRETDAILCLTTSGIPGRNLPITDRLQPLTLYPELVSFDAGSINMGENVFLNPQEFLDILAKETFSRGIKPELEVFEVGMVYTCLRYLEKNLLKPPLHFQFVLGTPNGMPATVKSLLHLCEIIPKDSTWSVIGIGPGQLPMAMMAMVMGGHARVGLEDSIYYSKGVLAKSSAQLVERVMRIAKEFGREIATPSDARRILRLGRCGRIGST